MTVLVFLLDLVIKAVLSGLLVFDTSIGLGENDKVFMSIGIVPISIRVMDLGLIFVGLSDILIRAAKLNLQNVIRVKGFETTF